jgi:hypothetical protein
MTTNGMVKLLALLVVVADPIGLSGCSAAKPAMAAQTTQGNSQTVTASAVRTVATTGTATITRPGFLGGFFRPQGAPPFGIFTPTSSQIAPVPYPTPGANLIGDDGYCVHRDQSGNSIVGSYQVDTNKLNDLIFLGARWTRMPAPQFTIDNSHVFGPGQYAFGALDAAQCISLVYHSIQPIINLEAGPINYNATPGTFSPQSFSTYQSAADFGQWCKVVAAHERAVFPTVTRFTLPGNEVNSNPQLFPGGEPQIAAYSKACYSAIKAANPSAFVYGFELNMDGSLNAAGFVSRMVALGCKVGTCYDGIAMHMTLRYPIPSASTPCYPKVGGDYSMQCITDVEAAAEAPIHVLISETVYPVPGLVPDEQTKGQAIIDEMAAFEANTTIDGALYANVDECPLYPSGFFYDGCLIDSSGGRLAAFTMLQWYAWNHSI